MASQPLTAAMGPFSRLIAYAVERIRKPLIIQSIMEDLVGFSKTIVQQWRHIKLSEVDAAEEKLFLDEATLRTTFPVLWNLLRSCLFATVIILSAVMSRILSDRRLAVDQGKESDFLCVHYN